MSEEFCIFPGNKDPTLVEPNDCVSTNIFSYQGWVSPLSFSPMRCEISRARYSRSTLRPFENSYVIGIHASSCWQRRQRLSFKPHSRPRPTWSWFLATTNLQKS